MHIQIDLRRLAILGLIGWAAAIAAKHEQPKILTVCQLLMGADSFDGRLVSVRGVLRTTGPDTVTPFFDELDGVGCSGPERTDMKVQVVTPDAHFLANPPNGYKPDRGSIRRAEELFGKALATGRPVEQFEATVEGIFYKGKGEPRRPLRHRQYPGYVVIQAFKNMKALPE